MGDGASALNNNAGAGEGASMRGDAVMMMAVEDDCAAVGDSAALPEYLRATFSMAL